MAAFPWGYVMRPAVAIFVMLPLILLVGAFVLVANQSVGAGSLEDGVYWDEPVARYVRQKVALTYVDELSEERASRAFYKALDGYVQDLDEYCDVIPPEEFRKWQESAAGEYAGIGIKVKPDDRGLGIAGVLPGGPAAKAGLVPGEIVTHADGRSLSDVNLKEVERQRLLKGEPGSRVVLTVVPASTAAGAPPAPPRQVVVTRALIRPPSVLTRRVGPNQEFAVIRLTEFTEATEVDFHNALKGFLDAGIKAVVLDLRGNGGGVLPTAVGVVNRFLEKGVVVRMEGRAPRSNRVYEAKPDKMLSDTIPLIVLVNGGSASASEVVAGALQDHRRALLVGERTYGKFLVQQVTDIPGREVSLQLTTSRYYLPSGRSYQRTAWSKKTGSSASRARQAPAGILPDVVVPLSEEQTVEFEKAQVNEEAAMWGEDRPYPDVPADHVDPQLGRAIELLQGQLALRRIRGASRGSRPQ